MSEQSYPTEVIIINRQPFREYDSRIVVYSLDRGRLDLVARGTKRFKSKLAGHIEPISLARIMVIKGKQYDYLASAQMTESFAGLKEDLGLLSEAGQVMKVLERVVRASEVDERIYNLTLAYLGFLNQLKPIDSRKFQSSFYLKFLALLGYQAQLETCMSCGDSAQARQLYFSYEQGGLICGACNKNNNIKLEMPEIKAMRVMLDSDFFEVDRLDLDIDSIAQATILYLKYNLNLDIELDLIKNI